MGANALSSHGVEIAYEQDPSGSPGSFTALAELGDVDWPDVQRAVTEVSAHGDTIDRYVSSGLLQRGELSFDLFWAHDNATHQYASSGLGSVIKDNTLTGFRLRGPDGAADTDEWILSGYVTSVGKATPAGEGAITAPITIRPSGPMKIDGEVIGT